MLRRMIPMMMIIALVCGTSYAGTLLTENEMDDVSAKGLQIITNNNEDFAAINDQDNNLDSVQLNDNAQQYAESWSIVNSAKSAVNVSANVLMDGIRGIPEPPEPPTGKSFSSSSASQSNDNTAINHKNKAIVETENGFAVAIAKNKNKETQLIENNYYDNVDGETGGTIEDQDNNNNSVQLNDNAQQYANAYDIVNASTSAINVAANIFISGGVTESNISQSNTQFASNMHNLAVASSSGFSLAVASNKEEGPTQVISNTYVNGAEDIEDQDNNNNSVQVNDYAQQYAVADSIINAAQSAANTSANMASMDDVSELSSVTQGNTNLAYNHFNKAYADGEFAVAIAKNKNKETQIVLNMPGEIEEGEGLGKIEDQDNNNNSVQLNDNAQQEAYAYVLENLSMSAANVALNLLGAGDVTSSTLTQSNTQVASNYDNIAVATSVAFAGNVEFNENPGQYIQNLHGTIYDQDNNNNSVQLNDEAQRDMVVDKSINAANSAVNAAQNIMKVGDVSGSILTQENYQYASNHNNLAAADCVAVAANINKQTQIVDNCFCSNLSEGTQDNNMNSVQLNDDAQQYASTIISMNLAESAANVALNVITAGTVSGSTISQSNTNVAINFSNIAISGGFALAGNAEFYGLR